MAKARTGRRRGYMVIEVTAVVSVVALLLAMGFMLYRSMRVAARVSVAASNLKQVSTGMELYFRKYSTYPPAGSDLRVELAPFIEDPGVFSNPLVVEETPGETVANLYQPPTLEDIDQPDTYITAMVSENGTTAVILKSGHQVVRRDDLLFNPDAPPAELLAMLNPPEEPDEDGPPPASDPPEDDGEGSPPPPEDDGEDDGGDEENPGSDAAPNEFTEEMPAGVVTTKDCFDAVFEVVSVDLTWGTNGPEVPVVVEGAFARPLGEGQEVPPGTPMLNDKPVTTVALFGGGDVDGGEVDTRVVRNEESFTLTATAAYGGWSATYSSQEDTDQVLTLRNGDLPGAFDPLHNPVAIGAGLGSMVDAASGTVTIGDNQVLYLFELGTEDTSHPGFDLQDLVVLVTLMAPADPSACEDALPSAPPPPPTGGGEDPPADDPPAEEEEEDEGFEVEEDGEVETRVCSDIRITAIGSQFGYADGTLVPIVANADIGAGWMALYDGEPVNGGEEYRQESVPAGTRIVLRGEIAGQYERWLWSRYGYPLSYTSTDGSGQVLTLQRGDTPVRFQPGFPCQAAVGDLLAPYVDPQTGVVRIESNEALYLWDFNPLRTNSGIDYQDLVVLATAVAAERDCDEEVEPAGSEPPAPARPMVTIAANGSTEGCELDNETTFAAQVANTATGDGDEASNVQLQIEVTSGEQYVREVSCNTAVGTIPAGESREVSVSVNTRSSWQAAYGQQIVLSVRVHNEDNWPEENEGKSVTVTIHGPEAPHPVLVLSPWGDAHNNRGHGNNGDHDDEDNPGHGGGGHGADDGYDDDGYDDDENGGGVGRTNNKQYLFRIRNTAAEGNPAASVRVSVSVVSGGYYLSAVNYDGNVGRIDAGEEKFVSVRMVTRNKRWKGARRGTEVQLQVSITRETNDPNENVGKTAGVILER